VAREYPHHPGHLLTGLDDLAEPHGLHPVFFGSYDWHSAVHQHWLLLRLLRRHPDLPERKRIHAWFDDRLTTTNVATEVACFDHPARRTFEWLAITPLPAPGRRTCEQRLRLPTARRGVPGPR